MPNTNFKVFLQIDCSQVSIMDNDIKLWPHKKVVWRLTRQKLIYPWIVLILLGLHVVETLVKYWQYVNDIVTFQKISTLLSYHIIIFGNVQSPADFVGWAERLRYSRGPSHARWRSGRGQRYSWGPRQRRLGSHQQGWQSQPGGKLMILKGKEMGSVVVLLPIDRCDIWPLWSGHWPWSCHPYPPLHQE